MPVLFDQHRSSGWPETAKNPPHLSVERVLLSSRRREANGGRYLLPLRFFLLPPCFR